MRARRDEYPRGHRTSLSGPNCGVRDWRVGSKLLVFYEELQKGLAFRLEARGVELDSPSVRDEVAIQLNFWFAGEPGHILAPVTLPLHSATQGRNELGVAGERTDRNLKHLI